MRTTTTTMKTTTAAALTALAALFYFPSTAAMLTCGILPETCLNTKNQVFCLVTPSGSQCATVNDCATNCTLEFGRWKCACCPQDNYMAACVDYWRPAREQLYKLKCNAETKPQTDCWGLQPNFKVQCGVRQAGNSSEDRRCVNSDAACDAIYAKKDGCCCATHECNDDYVKCLSSKPNTTTTTTAMPVAPSGQARVCGGAGRVGIIVATMVVYVGGVGMPVQF